MSIWSRLTGGSLVMSTATNVGSSMFGFRNNLKRLKSFAVFVSRSIRRRSLLNTAVLMLGTDYIMILSSTRRTESPLAAGYIQKQQYYVLSLPRRKRCRSQLRRTSFSFSKRVGGRRWLCWCSRRLARWLIAGLPWGWHFNPHTHPILTGIPIGIPMGIPIPTEPEVSTCLLYTSPSPRD